MSVGVERAADGNPLVAVENFPAHGAAGRAQQIDDADDVSIRILDGC